MHQTTCGPARLQEWFLAGDYNITIPRLAGHNAFELETHIRIVGEFGGLVGCGECCYGACERAPLFDQELKKLARSLGVSSSDLDWSQ